MKLTGQCTCGFVTYEMTSAPMFVNCCHCRSCQRETGTAFAINALIESSRVVTLTGESEKILTPSESGLGQQIWRCPQCKIALWSNYGGTKDKTRFVRVGTLDSPESFPPGIHIFTRSKLPWVTLPENVRAVEEYYDVASIWPEESLARKKVNLP